MKKKPEGGKIKIEMEVGYDECIETLEQWEEYCEEYGHNFFGNNIVERGKDTIKNGGAIVLGRVDRDSCGALEDVVDGDCFEAHES